MNSDLQLKMIQKALGKLRTHLNNEDVCWLLPDDCVWFLALEEVVNGEPGHYYMEYVA